MLDSIQPSVARRVVGRLLAGVTVGEAHHEGGLSMGQWLALFVPCINIIEGSVARAAWPDGKALLDQPALTVEMFSIMHTELAKHIADEMRRSMANG